VVEALTATGLTASGGEARRAITQGGVYLNNTKVDDDTATLDGAALAGGVAVLRRGKKTLAGVVFTA
jgi:tyrosyl-tRNA synthetase